MDDKERYLDLFQKYLNDNRSLTLSEEKEILRLNSYFVAKNIKITRLTEEDKYDIVNGKVKDLIKATHDLIDALEP